MQAVNRSGIIVGIFLLLLLMVLPVTAADLAEQYYSGGVNLSRLASILRPLLHMTKRFLSAQPMPMPGTIAALLWTMSDNIQGLSPRKIRQLPSSRGSQMQGTTAASRYENWGGMQTPLNRMTRCGELG